MTRWTRLPPLPSDPWRPWLMHAGSLTQRIRDHSRRFEVRIASLDVRRPNADEANAIGLEGHRAYVREVLLFADGKPVVMAHSIVAPQDLQHRWRAVAGLGTRPLAELLFADHRVKRQPFEYALIAAAHPLGRRAHELTRAPRQSLHARRSLFTLQGRPLLVTEVFLPRILELR